MNIGRARRVLLALAVMVLVPAGVAIACNGTDVTLSEDPAREAAEVLRNEKGVTYLDDTGSLLLPMSTPQISPALARQIAERFLKSISATPALPLTFKKLESVHGKIIYQFQSERMPGTNITYHLGPVNFTVDRLILDVDVLTGNLYLGNGCGAAPSQKLYAYNPNDFNGIALDTAEVFASNNTNFIAMKSDRPVKVDGIIDPLEWSGTGHKYFYLGEEKPHNARVMHNKASYYAEVWAKVYGDDIYFAVRTDTPNWVAIMIKGDPNLGMLPSYTDAKVLRSNGEITDRNFQQRPDKTYFLENDDIDNIKTSAVRQDDLYTYEFSFPLDTNDKQDIKLVEGKAYNIILAVGNSLDHYGIFTTDDSHKEHDHSKNNKEHVDVWASNETTLRIGSAAARDIYGASINPVFEGFSSGFQSERSENHYHYAGPPIKATLLGRSALTFNIGAVTVLLGALGVLLMLRGLNNRAAPGKEGLRSPSNGIDLLKYGWVRRFVNWKYFGASFIVPTMLIFLVITVLGLLDVQDGRRNIATVFTWTLWWSLIIFSFILLGRLWCMMCPFAVIGDFAQKLVSFNRKLPTWLQNMGLQTLGFIVLTLLFTLMTFDSRPFVTSVVILVITAGAIIFSIIYERRTFCRHLCPIGAVIGLYSTVSPVELVTKSKACCEAHKDKTCQTACPMLESPQKIADSVYCNFCMKCLPACPSNNLTLRLRPLGSDLHNGPGRPTVEALASVLLLGVIIVETLAMTSVWVTLKQNMSLWLGGAPDKVAYIVIFSAVVIMPLAIYYAFSWALRMWMQQDENGIGTMDIIKRFAFVFIPLGVSLHFAHNIQHLLVEGPIAVPVTLRLLNSVGSWSPFFINWNPLPLLGFKSIFFVQMGIIVAGFLFTLIILYRRLRRYKGSYSALFKLTTAMTLYAVVVVLSSIYMLGLPMNGRHIH